MGDPASSQISFQYQLVQSTKETGSSRHPVYVIVLFYLSVDADHHNPLIGHGHGAILLLHFPFFVMIS